MKKDISTKVKGPKPEVPAIPAPTKVRIWRLRAYISKNNPGPTLRRAIESRILYHQKRPSYEED